MLESEIEGRVVTWAKKHNFLVVKVRFVDVGYPDRLFISPKGHTIFIEFKSPGEKPEPIQFYRLRILNQRNIPAYWTDNYVGAINILKAALEPEDGLESQAVSDQSDQTSVRASVSRLIPRPRLGEDIDGPRYDKDSQRERTHTEGFDCGAPSGDDGDMASGDTEVD